MAGPSSGAGKRAAHVHFFRGVYSTSLSHPRLQLSNHGVPLCVCTCCSHVLGRPRSACLAESVAGWLEGFARVLDPPRPASLVCAAGEVCGRVAGCPGRLHAATSCNHSISKHDAYTCLSLVHFCWCAGYLACAFWAGASSLHWPWLGHPLLGGSSRQRKQQRQARPAAQSSSGSGSSGGSA